MPIRIHQRYLDALRPRIRQVVAQAIVSYGNHVDGLALLAGLWGADEALPRTGPSRDLLTKYVGDSVMMPFVIDYMRDRVALATRFDPQAPQKLVTEIENIGEADAFTEEILNALQSLPWQYTFTLALPPELRNFVRIAEIARNVGPRIAITPVDEDFRRRFSTSITDEFQKGRFLGLGIGGLLGIFPDWADDAVVLQITADGFVTRHGDGETFEDAHGILKNFFGLGIALGLFEVTGHPGTSDSNAFIFVHEVTQGREHWHTRTGLSFAETHTLSRLRFVPEHADDPNDQLRELVAQKCLNDMTAIFERAEANEKLLRACRWLFDSYIGDEPLLSFVQATVVLEIILGDKNTAREVGLGKLLANRCAYMIGASTSDRDTILREFDKIYDTRSDIVHNGVHRLDREQRRQLLTLRQLGSRIIRAEVALAVQEHETEQKATLHAQA